MSRCPFWSTERDSIECYKECPVLIGQSSEGQGGERCVFNDCAESNSVNFRDVIKEDYSFLNLAMYEDEKTINSIY